tara:strand:- start:285 stop:764 length:480 start_codon:yes stop_codon:yes gene_type:complete
MPQGKGTYGSKVGRPKKTKMSKKKKIEKLAKRGYQTRVSQKDILLKRRDPKLKGTKEYYDTSAFGDNPVTTLDPNLADFINKSQIKELEREKRAVKKEASIRKLQKKKTGGMVDVPETQAFKQGVRYMKSGGEVTVSSNDSGAGDIAHVHSHSGYKAGE